MCNAHLNFTTIKELPELTLEDPFNNIFLCIGLCLLYIFTAVTGSAQQSTGFMKATSTSNSSLNEAPIVIITRDDHVATIKMDYNEYAGNGGQLWNVGTDGTDPCGYRVQWWPDSGEDVEASTGCSTNSSAGTTTIATATNPHQLVTPNPVVQIQPIANNVTYYLKVEKLNGKGQVCSAPTELTFHGGDGSRVSALRSSMTFFDDFNLPEGAPDELKWNNAMGPQTDDRFNLFFINRQCHSHSLNGTRNDGAGDKSQTAQRTRKPMVIESGVRRRIVFDMDGIFSGRSVWYLDFNPVNTDLTGHLSFFDFDGDTGLPADVLRLKSSGDNLSVNLINSVGASTKVGDAHLPDFGRRMHTNVRRSFDVRLGTDGIQIFVDDTSVIDVTLPPGVFKPGNYYPLWSVVGYNTSKDDVPYFLSHWDNFGFDGPDVSPYNVHNYVTRIAGTDLQKASEYYEQVPIFTINVPDDIRPTTHGVTHEVWLVFSYLKNDFTTFNIEPGDHFTFNGQSYPLPPGANNSSPIIPDLVGYDGSPISNRVKIGEIQQGENSPLIVGDNVIQFFASNTGIMNVHIEVLYPQDSPPPPYTRPSDIHPFVYHADLPKLGPPAQIVTIDNIGLSNGANGELTGPTVSNTIPIEVLVGNRSWANWAPELLLMPAASAELWSTGSTPGIDQISLYLRPKGESVEPGTLVAQLSTNEDAPAPQVRYEFDLDTRNFPNGEYELFVQAINAAGIKSHPAYHGFAFKWDAGEISGAYHPVEITIINDNSFVFEGTQDELWIKATNWKDSLLPPPVCTGTIIINENCIVGPTEEFTIHLGCELIVNLGAEFEIQRP